MNDDYLDWLIDQVCDEGYEDMRERRYLFEALDHEVFKPRLPMDRCRAEDGLELRRRYISETGCVMADHGRCSVLEMMVALAMRCEEQIMIDLDVGRRVGRWFFYMVRSLGMLLDRGIFTSPYTVAMAVRRFQNGTYAPDGRGGLFYIPGYPKDLRNVDLWYQMQAYLNHLRESD
jgi:hypothetical protein